MHLQIATNWNFQPQYTRTKNQYDVKQGKTISEQHVDLKGVLKEELLYNVP